MSLVLRIGMVIRRRRIVLCVRGSSNRLVRLSTYEADVLHTSGVRMAMSTDEPC